MLKAANVLLKLWVVQGSFLIPRDYTTAKQRKNERVKPVKAWHQSGHAKIRDWHCDIQKEANEETRDVVSACQCLEWRLLQERLVDAWPAATVA